MTPLEAAGAAPVVLAAAGLIGGQLGALAVSHWRPRPPRWAQRAACARGRHEMAGPTYLLPGADHTFTACQRCGPELPPPWVRVIAGDVLEAPGDAAQAAWRADDAGDQHP